MRSISFALLGDSQLARARDRLQEVAEVWARGWGLERRPTVRLFRAWAEDATSNYPPWQLTAGEPRKEVRFGWMDNAPQSLGRALFLDDEQGAQAPPSALACHAGRAALQALADQIGALAAVHDTTPLRDGTPPPDLVLRRGSGAMAAQFEIGPVSLWCLMDHGWLEIAGMVQPAEALPALVPVHLPAAVKGCAVELPVRLGAAHTRFGNLFGMSVGDVIRLDTSAEAPLEVGLPTGEELFKGYLAAAGTKVVIEVAQS
jgi:hypothetical protein